MPYEPLYAPAPLACRIDQDRSGRQASNGKRMARRLAQGLAHRLAMLVLLAMLGAMGSSFNGYAQNLTPGGGLPGGPNLSDSLQTLEKTNTRCQKCLSKQQAYHQQVDVYEQAKLTYQAQLAQVRKKADAYLEARATYERDYRPFERLSKEADDILFGNSDRSLNELEYVKDDRDDAEPAARKAEAGLAAARRDLNIALKALEALRNKAVAEMRKAISLQLAMYRCELACEASELDLDEEPPKVSLPGGDALPTADGQLPTIAASEVPKPENFIGVVAKCAACQALAEKVNKIRSHRRSFASSADMLYQSLTANHASLKRRQREAVVLAQKERELYQQLLSSFTPRAPSEYADDLDKTFDNLDQQEAEAALRGLGEQRAENARDIAGLRETITRQTKGLLATIANYRIHSLLLAAAQKELAACEKTCKPAKDAKTALNPFVDPAYPQQENIDFILAKCPKCQVYADELMQILSKRRSVAGDIQTEVWLLKGRRKSLAEWEAQDDELEKEERLLGAFLIGDTGLQNEDKVLDRLFEIEDERTRLIQDMLWAEDEITRLEAQLKANMKEHAALTKRASELRKELADCEATCRDANDDGTKISLPKPIYDPAYPQPISFVGVVAKCASCQPEAETLNKLLSKRYVLAGDIQSTAARLKHNQALLAEREKTLSELLAREQELIPIYTKFDDSPEQAAARKELDQVDFARRKAEADIAGLKKLNAQDQAGLNKMLGEHAALEVEVVNAQAALATCEARNCGGAGQGGAIGIPGAGGQGGAVPASPFVSSDCQPCQTIVSMANDAVGTLIGAERKLKAAKDKLAQLKQEAQTRAERLRSVLARESQLSEAWLTTQDEDKRAKIDKELDRIDRQRNTLTDAQAKEAAEQKAAEAAIAEAQKPVDDLKALIAKLKADLADCEKQCQPAGQGGAIGIPGAGGQGGAAPASPFVSSDCQPCQTIVSMANDAVGTLIGAERKLKAAKDKLAQLKQEAQTRAERLRSVLARESQLSEAWLTTQGEDKRAEIDKELDSIDRQRNALTDAQAKEAAEQKAAEAAIAEAQKPVDDLKALIAKLKADLADCEKQCQPAGQGGSIGNPGAGGQGGAAPASPFVASDCQPCQTIVSMANDVIGTRINVAKQVAKGIAALKEVRAQIAAKEAAKSAAQEAFSQAIVQKAADAKAGKDVSALEDTIKKELDKASDLLGEIEDLQLKESDLAASLKEAKTYWERLKKREKELREALDRCEQKRCNKPANKTDISIGGPSGEDAGLQVILDKLQKGQCKGGAACDFEIILKFGEDKAFVGPVFVEESGALPGNRPHDFDEWSCSPTGKSGSLCLHPKGADAGETLSLEVAIQQPDNKGRLPQNCAELKVASDGRVLIQMIQAGLNAKGFNAGPADGISGRKTKSALAAFNAESGKLADLATPEQAYRALFGAPPMTQLPGGLTDTCIEVSEDPTPPLISKGVKVKIKLGVVLEELFKSGHVEEQQLEEELEEGYPDKGETQDSGWEEALFKQEFFEGGASPEVIDEVIVDEVKKKIKKKIPLQELVPKFF